MEKKTRIPTQKRALEKYNKIIDAANKLFNEKGYYNTTTADISKEAGVATGSVYAYFNDKKEIYIKVIEKINDNFNYPTRTFWQENIDKGFDNPETVKDLFKLFIKMMMDYHDFSKTFHDEMTALALLDEDIAKVVKDQLDNRVIRTREVFEALSIPAKSKEEEEIFIYYVLLLIDDVCHKILYGDDVVNVDLYIDKCVSMIYTLFENSIDYERIERS